MKAVALVGFVLMLGIVGYVAVGKRRLRNPRRRGDVPVAIQRWRS